MKKFSKKSIIIFVCITVVVLVIAAFSIKSGSSPVSNAVGTVFSPIQKGVAFVVNGAKNVTKNIANSGKNARKNKELKEKVLSLESELRMVEGYKTENERLKSLLDLSSSNEKFKSTAANIIGRDSDNLHSTLVIDKGSMHNVKKNSVVMVPEGLVGVVYEVGLNYSKVRTVLDSESYISAICMRSGDMGIVETTEALSSGGQCSMNYIDKAAKIVVGDMIETSGTGGIFPKGILIGKVTQIKEDSRNLTLNATVEVSVNINSTDIVLVSID